MQNSKGDSAVVGAEREKAAWRSSLSLGPTRSLLQQAFHHPVTQVLSLKWELTIARATYLTGVL